jgi:hypothetical protein
LVALAELVRSTPPRGDIESRGLGGWSRFEGSICTVTTLAIVRPLCRASRALA